MAKLRGKAKAAFLRRMARGRSKAGRASGRGHGGRKRRNPRAWKWTPARRRSFAKMLAGGRRKRPRPSPKSRKAASRRRLTRTATTTEMAAVNMADLVRNPRSKRRSSMAKRRRSRRSNPTRRHRRRHLHTPTRRHHRRRRHNPSMGGAVKSLLSAALPAAVGGAIAAVADAKLAGQSTIVRIGGKLVAAGLGGALLRKNPLRAAAFIGAMVGTAAHEGTIRAMGGVMAPSKPAGIKELAAMAAEDEQSMSLLQEELHGMGLLEDGTSGLGDVEPSLGDVEPSLGDDIEDLADELTE